MKNERLILPPLGYGTYPLESELLMNIPIAFENGYRLIDTSDNYTNEEFVGKAMKNIDKCMLITKFSQPYRAYEVRKCFEESCEKLLRKPDIYLLHWPYPFLWKKIWRQMETLYLQGECLAIGVCNFNRRKLIQLLKMCHVAPYVNQIERHPMFQQKDIVNFCETNEIKIISYSPVARCNGKLLNNGCLKNLAQKYDKSVEQIAIKWNVMRGGCPIPSSSSIKHICDNINIFDFELTEEELNDIDALESDMRVRYDPDRRFTLKEKMKFLFILFKNEIKGLFHSR